jgi:hypothetical protein
MHAQQAKKNVSLRTLCERVRCESIEGTKKAAWPDDMADNARHFYVAMAFEGRTMECDFWQGIAIRGNPTAYDVMHFLLQNAAYCDAPFSLWADDHGVNPDKKCVQDFYRTISKQTAKLRDFLSGRYEDFFYSHQE